MKLDHLTEPPSPSTASTRPSADHPALVGVRVLHVVTRYLRGGSEKRIGDIVRSLPEGEHHVVVGGGSDLDLAKCELSEARIIPVPSLVREIDPIRDMQTVIRLLRLVRSIDADLVVTHQSKGGVVGRVAAWAAARPAVHSLSMASFGPGYPAWQDRIFRVIERRLAVVTSRFVASGEDLRRRFVALGVAPRKVRVVRSGLALPGDGEIRGPRERPMLLYLGSLDERKNVLALVPFLERVCERTSVRPRLVVAGEGPLAPRLLVEIRRAGLELDVEMLGFVPDPYELIRRASSMVLLSLAEGLPQVLVQAAAVGTPFVSYDVDGARELVALGARGSIVPVGDVDGAAEAATAVLRDPWRPPSIDVDPWRPEAILAGHRAVLLEALGSPHLAPRRVGV